MFYCVPKKIFLVISITLLLFIQNAYGATAVIQVRGAVINPLELSLGDLKNMSPFHVNGVVRIEEKKTAAKSDEQGVTDDYRGVLLRDVLEKAGMKFVRKFEPGVYIRVRGGTNQEAVFSFGEIFYSSSGRSILLSYEKSGRPINPNEGVAELVVTTDVRAGRFIKDVREIIVERVDIPLAAYDDKEKNVIRPPSTSLSIIDRRTRKTKEFGKADLDALPKITIHNALMAGDCEGFNGIHTFEGSLLRSVLEWFGLSWADRDYSRSVVISSEDGFCATFSLGELFNSRLDNNIIIAGKKNGVLLDAKSGFAVSVVGEDRMGGRSVKRIHRIEIY